MPEISSKHEEFPSEIPDSEVQREEEEFEIQIPDEPEEPRSHQKNYLRYLLPKGDLPGIEKRYKKLRSIKLLLGLSEKG